MCSSEDALQDMDKVLITGARGFVGRHCLNLLTDAGFEVHAVSSSLSLPMDSQVIWHSADLLNVTDADRLIDQVRPVSMLHLAWITTPGEYWTSPFNDVWRQASEHLIGRAIEHGLRRLVAAGTCAEYDWSIGRCDEQTTPLSPGSPYSRSKDELRRSIQALASRQDLSFAWARVFFLYGPGEPAGRLVPSVIGHLLQEEPAQCSKGVHRRDFMYVRDAAAALVALLQSDLVGPVNIGTGQAVAVRDIAVKIGEVMGKPDLVRLGGLETARPEAPLVVAGTDRIRGELGFRPQWDIDRGLAETIAWWRAGGESR